MPATFTLKPQDFNALIKELRAVDKELINELRREFRNDLKPIATSLASGAPAKSPLSGFTKGRGAQAPYLYRKPSASIKVSTRARPGKAQNLVAIRFGQPALSILELAGVSNVGKNKGGMTQRGLNLVQGLRTAGYSMGDRGRFVIPQFYRKESEVRAIAGKILQKFGDKVSRKLKGVD
jgi:hypothetical protein